MKTFERVILEELHLRYSHLIDQQQYGVLPRKSCCTQRVDFCEILCSRASQRLGPLRRTCNFINIIGKRRALYLSQLRSQLEYCVMAWRPSSKSVLDRIEGIKKKSHQLDS